MPRQVIRGFNNHCHLIERVKVLVRTASSDSQFQRTKTVRVKLTGDWTYLGSKIHVVTFRFTVLDEGDIAKSANGYHLLCLLKLDESYDSLAQGLKDIDEMSKIACDDFKVDECSYSVRFYLGSDCKFLAMVCSLDSANSKYPCIWCTSPKQDTTPKRNGLFKILRKEHAQLHPSLLHQNYLPDHHGNSIAHICHCLRMSRLTELSSITFIYSYEWLTISSIC